MARLQHGQCHRPGNGADDRIDDPLEIAAAQLLEFKCLHRLTEKVALGQRAEILRVGAPEAVQLLLVARAQINGPEVVEHFVAMQAHFIGVVERLGLRPILVEAAVEVQQVGIVLIGGAKAMHHQLGEGQRFVGLFAGVLPAGKRLRAALRQVETMEINLIRVDLGKALAHQQLAGDLMGLVVQAGAKLHDGGGDGLE